MLRSVALTAGGVGLIGLALGVLQLAHSQPDKFFDLLGRWGFVWVLVLAALIIAWDLLKVGLSHLGKLADSVQESAVAIRCIADRDDRERDRMITETAFIGHRMERQSLELAEIKSEQHEQRGQLDRIEQLLKERRQHGS